MFQPLVQEWFSKKRANNDAILNLDLCDLQK
jgi:hypothetical protein